MLIFIARPVKDLVCEVLARPLERTSQDTFRPLPHLLSNQLLKYKRFRSQYWALKILL